MGYRKPVPNNVSKALGVVNQERLFYQKCIDAQIITYNDTILNTYCSFVLNKYITIDDKDPVWMNETKKLKINFYKQLGKKLNNSLLQGVNYWSILKTFYNDIKVLSILPVLVGNNVITDIKNKPNNSNKFFADQCTPLQNDSVLPINQMSIIQSKISTLRFQ